MFARKADGRKFTISAKIFDGIDFKIKRPFESELFFLDGEMLSQENRGIEIIENSINHFENTFRM